MANNINLSRALATGEQANVQQPQFITPLSGGWSMVAAPGAWPTPVITNPISYAAREAVGGAVSQIPGVGPMAAMAIQQTPFISNPAIEEAREEIIRNTREFAGMGLMKTGVSAAKTIWDLGVAWPIASAVTKSVVGTGVMGALAEGSIGTALGAGLLWGSVYAAFLAPAMFVGSAAERAYREEQEMTLMQEFITGQELRRGGTIPARGVIQQAFENMTQIHRSTGIPMQDIESVVAEAYRGGALRNIQNIDEFNREMTGLVQDVDKIARVLMTTREQATQMINSLMAGGLKRQGAASTLLATGATAKAFGVGPEELEGIKYLLGQAMPSGGTPGREFAAQTFTPLMAGMTDQAKLTFATMLAQASVLTPQLGILNDKQMELLRNGQLRIQDILARTPKTYEEMVRSSQRAMDPRNELGLLYSLARAYGRNGDLWTGFYNLTQQRLGRTPTLEEVNTTIAPLAALGTAPGGIEELYKAIRSQQIMQQAKQPGPTWLEYLKENWWNKPLQYPDNPISVTTRWYDRATRWFSGEGQWLNYFIGNSLPWRQERQIELFPGTEKSPAFLLANPTSPSIADNFMKNLEQKLRNKGFNFLTSSVITDANKGGAIALKLLGQYAQKLSDPNATLDKKKEKEQLLAKLNKIDDRVDWPEELLKIEKNPSGFTELSTFWNLYLGTQAGLQKGTVVQAAVQSRVARATEGLKEEQKTKYQTALLQAAESPWANLNKLTEVPEDIIKKAFGKEYYKGMSPDQFNALVVKSAGVSLKGAAYPSKLGEGATQVYSNEAQIDAQNLTINAQKIELVLGKDSNILNLINRIRFGEGENKK